MLKQLEKDQQELLTDNALRDFLLVLPGPETNLFSLKSEKQSGRPVRKLQYREFLFLPKSLRVIFMVIAHIVHNFKKKRCQK